MEFQTYISGKFTRSTFKGREFRICLCPSLQCQVFFRTKFHSHRTVEDMIILKKLSCHNTDVKHAGFIYASHYEDSGMAWRGMSCNNYSRVHFLFFSAVNANCERIYLDRNLNKIEIKFVWSHVRFRKTNVGLYLKKKNYNLVFYEVKKFSSHIMMKRYWVSLNK